MREIRLIRLSMENFKGCAAQTFEFDGRNANIYGANGTGKSTVYSALTWLLFDKVAGDDGTVQSNPDIKPNNEQGEVRDHAAVSKVEAAFSVDGELITLRREFHENWTQQRGSSDKTMTGHTSEYYWNDVPVQMNAFRTRLEEQFTKEAIFWTLSNVHWFCRGIDWKKRRDMLTEVCGLPDDQAIMDANPEQFAELSMGMAGKPLMDYRAWVDKKMKELNGAQTTYPARLDEVEKTIQKYIGINFDALRTMREGTEAQLRQRMDELAQLSNGTLAVSKRNEMQAVQNQARDLDLRNNAFRQSQNAPSYDRRPGLERNLAQWQAALARSEQHAASEQRTTEGINARMSALKAEFEKIDTETFSTAVCPTCGQVLPPNAQETAKAKFEADKERRKASVVQSAQRERNALNASSQRKASAEAEASEARRNIDAVTAELAACPVVAAPTIANLPGYEEEMAAFRGRIAGLEQEVAALEQQNAASRDAIHREIARLRQEKQSLDDQIATERILKDAQTREAELRAEAQKASDELNALEKQKALCEDFIRFKAGYIENGVNQRFRTVRFKLFQPQVNGGLKDCCDVYVGGGRLGHGLNTGAEYNAGIDVIDGLSNYYGVRVPLFIDGAESVSDPLPINTQVIRLTVSAIDRELRCAYED